MHSEEEQYPKIVINGCKIKFSDGIVLRSILKTGVNFFQATDVVKVVKESIKNKKELSTEELFEICRDALKEVCGSKFSRRYEIWHRYNIFRRRGLVEPLEILLGGAPVVGKTVSTTDLAFRLMISRAITTDAIRRILKVLVKENPVLHLPSYKVWKAIRPENVELEPEIEGFVKQVNALAEYIIEIVSKSIENGKDVAIEGVHIAPWILPKELRKKPNIIQALIAAPNKEIYRQMFLSKKLREGESPNKEVLTDFETCWKINEFLVKEARKEKISIVKFQSFEQTVEDLLEVVNFRIRKIVREINGKR